MRKMFMITLLLFAVLIGGYKGYTAVKSEDQRATWLWDAQLLATDADRLLDFLKKQRVTKIHIQMNEKVNSETYAQFIQQANKAGIAVFALGGSVNWIDQRGKFEHYVDWLAAYQEKYANARFAGMHLDIEPYLHDDWDDEQEEIILQFQELMIETKRVAKKLQLPLEADIPFWFEKVKYHNVYGNGNLAEWLIEKTDGVTVMAYRNNAADISEYVRDEMAYGAKWKKPVTIGVETVPSNEGKHIDFAKETEKTLEKALEEVYKKHGKNKAFGGFAIHDVKHWKKLVEKK